MIDPIQEQARGGRDAVRFATEDAEPIEQWRTRVGLLCLVVGVGLLITAWGSWAYRVGSDDEPRMNVAAPGPTASEISPRQVDAAQAAQWLLMWASLLILAVIAGTYAVVRGARRFQQLADHKRAKPSPLDDIWSQHRLPEDLDDDA